jgi:predicted ATP-grasp superfamily ATP-dependent carboligase
MDTVDISTATILATVVISNIGIIIGSYISLKVSVAKLEVKVDTLGQDVDAIAENYRKTEKSKYQKEGLKC